MGRKKTSVNPLCGQRIRELCRTLGLSEKEFADKIGVCQQTISNIVTGNTGLSKKTLRKIINRYPRVSEAWLRGDPDAKINLGARIFANEQEALAKRHALENVLNIIGVKISPPYDLNGFDDCFYDLISPDNTSVALSRSQLDAMIETIFSIITSYLQSAVKSGRTAEEIMDDASGYAVSRLDEVCADIYENIEKSDDEKTLIDDLQEYAHVEMHKYDNMKYPISWSDETEDDIIKKIFEESQKLDLQRSKSK